MELIPFLEQYLQEEKVELFVVGLPKQMDNTPSQSEGAIQGFLEKLAARFPEVPITRQDERFTSKMAVRSMVDSGMKKKKRQDRALIDEISATLILQAYLNRK